MGVMLWFAKMLVKILKPLVKLGFIDMADIEDFINGLIGDESETTTATTEATSTEA